MFERILPIGLAAAVLATLTGCPKAVDYYGGDGMERPAPEAQPQAPASSGESLRLSWGPGLVGDERGFATAYAQAAMVHAQLAAGDWDQSAVAVDAMLDELKAVSRAESTPKAVADRVAAVLPVVRTLGRMIVVHDPVARRLASGLVGQLQSTASNDAVLSWIGPSGGGGGPAAGPDELSLDLGATLTGASRDYAEAYARAAMVHMQLDARQWDQAADELMQVRDRVSALSENADTPEAVRMRLDTLSEHIDTLAKAIASHDAGADMAANRLVNAFNGATNDPAVLAWLH